MGLLATNANHLIAASRYRKVQHSFSPRELSAPRDTQQEFDLNVNIETSYESSRCELAKVVALHMVVMDSTLYPESRRV
jgi:hypothetical protein